MHLLLGFRAPTQGRILFDGRDAAGLSKHTLRRGISSVLQGAAIYSVGPTPERPGEVIGSAGPTTSGRMDAMSPRLLDLGNKIMIGKGKRDAAVKEAVVRSGAVYLAALGGAGALMARSVKTLEVIAWPDLGCEAVRRLTVEKMPLTVILDAHGGDLYTSGPAAYLETVK